MRQNIENVLVVTGSTILPSTQIRFPDNLFEGESIQLTVLSEQAIKPSHIHDNDIVIFQRRQSTYCCLLFQLSLSRNKITIYDIDDNLLLTPEYSQHKCKKHNADIIKFFLSNAHHVTTSTRRLESYLSEYKNVIVIPNTLPKKFFNKECVPGNKNKILITNSDYFKLIESCDNFLDDIYRYLGENATTEVTLLGSITGIENHPIFTQYSHNLSVVDFIYSYTEYLDYLRQGKFTIALAPLERTEFHSFKSCIKYLDFTSANIPTVFSNVPPYADCITHLENGLIVDNEQNQWYEAIQLLMNDRSLRRKILSTAVDDCLTRFTRSTSNKLWLDLFNNDHPVVEKTAQPLEALVDELSEKTGAMESTIKRQEELIFAKDAIMSDQDRYIMSQDKRIKELEDIIKSKS